MNDYGTFRLRAFERSFVAKTLAFVDLDYLVASTRGDSAEAYWRQFLDGQLESGFGNGRLMLGSCILAEAGEWIRAGREVGYFSRKSPLTSLVLGKTDFLESDELFHFLDALCGYWKPSQPAWSSEEGFADSLTTATVNLTPERSEYLRLVYFASNTDWSERLNELQALTSVVALRPDTSISNQVMDRMAWAFYGTDEWDESSPGPARWRSILAAPDLATPIEELGKWGFERRIALGEQLSTLRGAVEDLLELEIARRLGPALSGAETLSMGVRRHGPRTALEEWVRFGTTPVPRPPESFGTM
jgi:hypothetical protein